jgi:hypothetical protein
MSNQQDVTKFEFLLTLEGNIICQRFFNVKNHNPKSKRSLDLHEEVKNICEEISQDLKIKSSDFLCENQNFLYNSEDVEEVKDDKKEYFLLEIKQDDHVFIQRIFPAYLYHPKVRYTVDIRPKLKDILNNLTEVLSLQDLETSYLGYNLQTN